MYTEGTWWGLGVAPKSGILAIPFERPQLSVECASSHSYSGPRSRLQPRLMSPVLAYTSKQTLWQRGESSQVSKLCLRNSTPAPRLSLSEGACPGTYGVATLCKTVERQWTDTQLVSQTCTHSISMLPVCFHTKPYITRPWRPARHLRRILLFRCFHTQWLFLARRQRPHRPPARDVLLSRAADPGRLRPALLRGPRCGPGVAGQERCRGGAEEGGGVRVGRDRLCAAAQEPALVSGRAGQAAALRVQEGTPCSAFPGSCCCFYSNKWVTAHATGSFSL